MRLPRLFLVAALAALATAEVVGREEPLERREGDDGKDGVEEVSRNGATESNLARAAGGKRNVSEEVKERTNGKPSVEPREEDLIEAADFGVRAMNDLYLIKEPKLFSMGLFLSPNNPARYVAAFNAQTEEAKHLAKFGYAALEAAKKIRIKFPDISRQSSIFQTSKQSLLGQQCPKKGIPQCPPASLKYRTSDGSCNNLKELWWGSAMSTMQRFLPSMYDDGVESIRRSVTGSLLPSARQVSDHIHKERDAPLLSVTHMLMQWGQFIDHDITATAQSRAFNGTVPQCCLNSGLGFQPPEFMHPDCLPIAVHPQDSHLRKFNVRCLEFVRSGPAPREDCEFGAREQLSQVTSFIDASTVYSSSARQCDNLRIFRNGLMQYGKIQSRKPVLPRDDSDLCRRGSLSTSCFRAGDGRLSEQPALISLHVVFLRMHNRLATLLSALNQHWSDEKIFQETRKIVGALVQHITYNEFLPIVLGRDVMKIFDIELVRKGYYRGYDESVNPNIANAFTSAAYRFGHSLVQHSFVRFDRNHKPILNNVTIHEEFSNPVNLETPGSVDRILLGLINQPSQKRDEFISEELTNHLFQTPGFAFGMDLASLNIQRGRDHGIPPFAEWRQPCMLSPIKNWKDLERIMPPETAKKFKDLYASVEDIDLFSAGLAEKPVTGGLVGATFACIIAQQFRSLRKGDRFWYENPFIESGFTPAQLQQIRKVTFSQILCRTLDNIDSIQPFAMLTVDTIRNQRLMCDDPVLDQINLEPWIENPLKQRELPGLNEGVYNDEGEESEKLNVDIKDAESRAVAQKKVNQRLPQRPNQPVTSKINQQNRIVVKRPLGPGENITIIVNNHAVHAPIIIRDSIYGTKYDTNGYSNAATKPSQQQVQTEYYKPTTHKVDFVQYTTTTRKPTTVNKNYIQYSTTTEKPKLSQKPYDNHVQSSHPYYPHNFQDHSNPNPPTYGFNSKPLNNYYPNNEFFSYNLPTLINSIRPQLEQDYDNQEEYLLTIRKRKPTQRPELKPEQSNFNVNQQEPYFITQKPNLGHQSNVQHPFINYNQNAVTNIPSKLQGSYSQINNRFHENTHSSQSDNNNPYLNFEPNKSDRDEYYSSNQPRPIKKPTQSSHNSQYNRYTDKRPTTKVPPNQSKFTTFRTPPDHNNWENSNTPQHLYYFDSSLSDYLSNKLLQKPNYSFQTNFNINENSNIYDAVPKKESEHSHYRYNHTTESDIEYVSNNKPQKQTSNIHLLIPSHKVQNRESEGSEIENLPKAVPAIINSNSAQNFSKINEFVVKNTYQELPYVKSNIPDKFKLTTTATIITNKINKVSTQSTVEKIMDTNLSRIKNETSSISDFSLKIPVSNQSLYASVSNELPRPIKLRPGN